MELARQIEEDNTDGPVLANEQANDASSKVIGHIGQKIGELSVNVAGMSGNVADVSAELTKQTDTFNSISVSVHQIAGQNSTITDVLNTAQSVAGDVHSGLSDSTNLIENIFSSSKQNFVDIADASNIVVTGLEEVSSNITEVQNFSVSIQKIATETQMLAINAGIMAARAGEEGKGFAIIAESIRELALQTTAVSKDISSQLKVLKSTLDQLTQSSEKNSKISSEAKEQAQELDDQLNKFRAFGTQVEELTSSISKLSEPIESNANICNHVVSQMSDLNQDAKRSTQALVETSTKFEELVTFSEEMICLIEESGVQTEDSALIKKCIETADRISVIFENAVASGSISQTALFDENYILIDGTNPAQHTTSFSDFTDQVLTPIQEAFLEVDDRVAFCAAVDRNGYLPTHNLVYSKPQSHDPAWNAANCRNRRIFDDRTGLSAGRNQKQFLLQTYRRDMGAGEFVLMKDLSAPIQVNGRHWGGLRVGYKVR